MQMSRRAGALAAYVAAGAAARSLQASDGDVRVRMYDLISCFEDAEKDFIEVRFPGQTELCNEAKTCFCASGEGITKFGRLTRRGATKVALEFCFQEDSIEVKFFKGASACDGSGSPTGVVQVGAGDAFFSGQCTPVPDDLDRAEGWIMKAIDAGPLIKCADQRWGQTSATGSVVLPFRGGDGYFDLGVYDDLAKCESLLDREQAYVDPATIKSGTLPDRKFDRCNLCIEEDRYPDKNEFLQVRYTGSFLCKDLWTFGLKGGVDEQLCGVTGDLVNEKCGCPRRGGRRYGFRFPGELDMCDETKTCICAPGTDIIASSMERALEICLKPNGVGATVKIFDRATTCSGSPAAVFELQGTQVDDFMIGKCMDGRNGGNTVPLFVAKEAIENIRCFKERLSASQSPPTGSAPSPSPPSPTPSLPTTSSSPPSPMPSPPAPTPSPLSTTPSPPSPMPSPPNPSPSPTSTTPSLPNPSPLPPSGPTLSPTLPNSSLGLNDPANELKDSEKIRSVINTLRCSNSQAPLSWSAGLEKKAIDATDSTQKFRSDIYGEERSLYILDFISVELIVTAMYERGEGQKPNKKSASRGLYNIVTEWESGTAMACGPLKPADKKNKRPGWICFFGEVDPETLASEECRGDSFSRGYRNLGDRQKAFDALAEREIEEFGVAETVTPGEDVGSQGDLEDKDIGVRSATLSALVAGCWCLLAAALP